MTPRPESNTPFTGGRRPLGTRSLGLSIASHVIAIVAMFWVIPALEPDRHYYRVIELQVVSAAPAQPEPPDEEVPPAPEEDLVIETPDPEPPVEVEEEPIPVIEEDPEPEPEPDSLDTPEPEPVETPPLAETPAPADTEEDEGVEEAFADVQARQEGFKADYPDYFANVLRNVERCLQRLRTDNRAGTNRTVTVRFVIERNGKTADFGVVRTSGSNFDWDVLGAIECAGNENRLGPLPEDYPYEVLPVTLEVSPKGSALEVPQAEGER